MKLTKKQERFCREYIVDLCGAQAAIRAGYSAATAAAAASRLLMNVNVQRKIEALQAERARSLDITAERVLRELARVAFADMSGVVRVNEKGGVEVTPTDRLTEDQRRAIASVSQTASGGIRIRFADKLRALELVGRHIGMFVERVKIEPPGVAEELTDEELDRIISGEREG